MKKNSIIIQQIFFWLFIALFCHGCKEPAHLENDAEAILKSAYLRLGYTKQGLDYPGEEELLSWRKNKYYSKTYTVVQEGKRDLLDQIASDPQQVLMYTLDTISLECNQDTDTIEDDATAIGMELRCVGAITALYFFNRPDEDRTIITHLKKASSEVFDSVQNFRYEWQYNRPDPQAWIDALEKIPDDQVDKDITGSIVDNIKEAIRDPHPEKFGVML
jgi:hypothetical protein